MFLVDEGVLSEVIFFFLEVISFSYETRVYLFSNIPDCVVERCFVMIFLFTPAAASTDRNVSGFLI